MPIPELDNLVQIGRLRNEPRSQSELDGLVRSATARLRDAENEALAPESRFDLAYNAAHALALAALRHHGYRSTNRYLVFQAVEHTLGLPGAKWRVLAKCHDIRNRVEYEGEVGVDTQLLDDLLEVTRTMLEAVPGDRSR